MKTTTTNWRLWQPPSETIDAIASVLGSHWAAAKSLHPASLWTRPATWLRRQASGLVDRTQSEFTI
jgi:hypothetical protein